MISTKIQFHFFQRQFEWVPQLQHFLYYYGLPTWLVSKDRGFRDTMRIERPLSESPGLDSTKDEWVCCFRGAIHFVKSPMLKMGKGSTTKLNDKIRWGWCYDQESSVRKATTRKVGTSRRAGWLILYVVFATKNKKNRGREPRFLLSLSQRMVSSRDFTSDVVGAWIAIVRTFVGATWWKERKKWVRNEGRHHRNYPIRKYRARRRKQTKSEFVDSDRERGRPAGSSIFDFERPFATART